MILDIPRSVQKCSYESKSYLIGGKEKLWKEKFRFCPSFFKFIKTLAVLPKIENINSSLKSNKKTVMVLKIVKQMIV